MQSRKSSPSTSISLTSSLRSIPTTSDSLRDELPIPLVLSAYFACYEQHRKDIQASGSLSMTTTSAADFTWGVVSNVVSKLNPTSFSYGDLKQKFVELRGGYSFPIREGLLSCMKEYESKSTQDYKTKLIGLANQKIQQVVETQDSVSANPLNLESTLVRRWLDCVIFLEELAYLSQTKEVRNTQSHLTQTFYGAIDHILSILKDPGNRCNIEYNNIIRSYKDELKKLERQKENNDSISSALNATNKTHLELTIKNYTRIIAIFTQNSKWLIRAEAFYPHLYKFDPKKMSEAGITPIKKNGRQLSFIDTLKDVHQEGYFHYNYARQGFAKFNGQKSAFEFISEKKIEYYENMTLEAERKKNALQAALAEEERLRELHRLQEIEEQRRKEQEYLQQADELRQRREAMEAERAKNGLSYSSLLAGLEAAQEKIQEDDITKLLVNSKLSNSTEGQKVEETSIKLAEPIGKEEPMVVIDITPAIQPEKKANSTATKYSPEFGEFQKHDVQTAVKLGAFPPPPAAKNAGHNASVKPNHASAKQPKR